MAARKIIWTQKQILNGEIFLNIRLIEINPKIQYQTKQAYCRNYKANC